MDSKIKEFRDKKGLSIIDLSELSGVNRNLISNLENGRVKFPSTKTLSKLSKALGVKILDLWVEK